VLFRRCRWNNGCIHVNDTSNHAAWRRDGDASDEGHVPAVLSSCDGSSGALDHQELCTVMCGSNISKADYQEITCQIPFDWVCRSCSEAVRAPDHGKHAIDNVDINAAGVKCYSLLNIIS